MGPLVEQPQYLRNKVPQNGMKKGEKIKKLLAVLIALALVFGISEVGLAFDGKTDCVWIIPLVEGKARLESMGESGICGKVKLVTRSDNITKVVLRVKDLEPRSSHVVNIHSGSCDGTILLGLKFLLDFL